MEQAKGPGGDAEHTPRLTRVLAQHKRQSKYWIPSNCSTVSMLELIMAMYRQWACCSTKLIATTAALTIFATDSLANG